MQNSVFRPWLYLGYYIDATGIKPIADKVQAIVNFPKPSNMRQLRRLIGMIAFCKKFIPLYPIVQKLLDLFLRWFHPINIQRRQLNGLKTRMMLSKKC